MEHEDEEEEEEVWQEASESRFPLHRAVWRDRPEELREWLATTTTEDKHQCDVNEQDPYGNTALHVAIMLGRKECLRILLQSDHIDSRIQNAEGWSPLAEAVCYGDREMIEWVYVRRARQMQQRLKDHLPQFFQRLEQVPDFQLEMFWNFQSWIPFVSRICPSDTNLISKRKSSVRFDTTIAGFEKMRWIRGNLSFMVVGNFDYDTLDVSQMNVAEMKQFLEKVNVSHADCVEKSDLRARVERTLKSLQLRHGNFFGKLTAMNHDQKVYSTVEEDVSKHGELQQMINMLMSAPRTSTRLNGDKMAYQRAKSGIWPFQSDRVETIGGYEASVWDITGVEFVTDVRSEHLDKDKFTSEMAAASSRASHAPPQRTNSSSEHLGDGSGGGEMSEPQEPTEEEMNAEEENFRKAMQYMTKYKPSLEPPPPPQISEDQYFDQAISNFQLGRPKKLKRQVRQFKGKMWACEDYPLALSDLISLLKVLSPCSVILKRVVEFLELDLPPGFPIKIEIPIVPMVSVQVTFQNYAAQSAPPEFFTVPADYVYKDEII